LKVDQVFQFSLHEIRERAPREGPGPAGPFQFSLHEIPPVDGAREGSSSRRFQFSLHEIRRENQRACFKMQRASFQFSLHEILGDVLKKQRWHSSQPPFNSLFMRFWGGSLLWAPPRNATFNSLFMRFATRSAFLISPYLKIFQFSLHEIPDAWRQPR